jgi:hypothetical protein
MLFKSIISGLLFAFSFAIHSQAAVVSVTATGSVSDGFDNFGLFGTPGSLTGSSWSATYLFETTAGTTFSNASSSYSYGGVGAPCCGWPNRGASITINGHTFSPGGSVLVGLGGLELKTLMMVLKATQTMRQNL